MELSLSCSPININILFALSLIYKLLLFITKKRYVIGRTKTREFHETRVKKTRFNLHPTDLQVG